MVPKICLVGAAGAGKSALLAQAARACRDGGHGWPEHVSFRLFGRRPGPGDRPWIPAASYELGALEDAFRAGALAPHELGGGPPDRILRLLVERRDGGARAPTLHPVDVVDLPGDLVDRRRLRALAAAAPVADAGEAAGPDGPAAGRDAAVDAVATCDALVVVTACRGHDDRAFAEGVDDLRLLVGAAGGFSFARLVVAWTRYDEVVAAQRGAGDHDADETPFDRALRPEVAGEILATLRAGRPATAAAIEALEEDLERRLGAAGAAPGAILHVPVSATGFSPQSGLAANGAPNALPFLAADPLLLALFGGPACDLHLPHRPPEAAVDAGADDDGRDARPSRPGPRATPLRRLLGLFGRGPDGRPTGA